jgi:hypothetical protein
MAMIHTFFFMQSSYFEVEGEHLHVFGEAFDAFDKYVVCMRARSRSPSNCLVCHVPLDLCIDGLC